MPFSNVTNAMQMPERSSGSQASYNSTMVGNDVTQYSTHRQEISRDKSTCIAGPAGNGGASFHYYQDPTRCLSLHNTRPIAPSLLTGNISQGRTWIQCGAFGYIEKGGARLTDGLPNRRRLHIRSAKQSHQHQGKSNIQIRVLHIVESLTLRYPLLNLITYYLYLLIWSTKFKLFGIHIVDSRSFFV